MKNVMTYNGYTGTVEYSEDDGILFGRLVGINDIVSYEGESVKELREAFQASVDDYLEHCKNIVSDTLPKCFQSAIACQQLFVRNLYLDFNSVEMLFRRQDNFIMRRNRIHP